MSGIVAGGSDRGEKRSDVMSKPLYAVRFLIWSADSTSLADIFRLREGRSWSAGTGRFAHTRSGTAFLDTALGDAVREISVEDGRFLGSGVVLMRGPCFLAGLDIAGASASGGLAPDCPRGEADSFTLRQVCLQCWFRGGHAGQSLSILRFLFRSLLSFPPF